MLLRVLLVVLALSVQVAYSQDAPVWVNVSAIARNADGQAKSFSEDTPAGTIIATVIARDPQGFPVKYTLGGNSAEYLEIGETSGDIKLKAAFDFEQYAELGIEVTATDREGLPTKFTTSISIRDANDNAPAFAARYYNFDLNENAPVGTVVANLTVTDRDYEQPSITVTCDDITTLERRRACAVFQLQTIQYSNRNWNGRLILKLPLDYELEQSYSVRVYASDSVHITPLEIQIGVKDVNDSPPRFVRALGVTLLENQPIGTNIDYVSAVDTDSSQRRPIQYELYGDDEALTYFTVDPVKGNITNLKVLDYEDPNRTPGKRFLLMIRAREVLSSNPPLLGNDAVTTAIAQVSIRIEDMNDWCPQFDQGVYRVSVRENIPQGSNIPLQMTVTDRDSGDRAAFDLILSPFTDIFAVKPTAGISPASITISVIKAEALDYDSAQKSYTLIVRAVQSVSGSSLDCTGSGTATVIIELVDVNDNSPTFPAELFTASVTENALEGTFVIQITAIDKDSGIIGQEGVVYNISNEGSELFYIDNRGVVTVRACNDPRPGEYRCIDYEKQRRYELLVKATDNRGNSPYLVGTAALIINVEDVNDNRPIFTEDIYIRSIRERENRTTDKLELKATDRDQNVIAYTITPNQQEAALWQVDSVSGLVSAVRPIVYSDLLRPNLGYFKFQATATDGTYTALATVTIYVIDVNDNPPIFSPIFYNIAIPEDKPENSFVIQVSVTDADSPTTGNGLVDISIDDGSLGMFVVMPVNTSANNIFLGNIMTAPDATFDYDARNRYNLTLRGRDRGSPSLTGTAYVTINILDTNNKNPYFDPPSQSVSVYENAPIGTLVTTVAAYDRDADRQLVISFGTDIHAYQSGQPLPDRTMFAQMFAMSPDGRVTVSRPLDRKFVDFITYELFVKDTRAATPQNGTGILFIRILEFNDQGPYFELSYYNLSVLEERPLASFVGSLVASDADNLIASYQLTSNPGELLAIGLSSGVLRVNGRLDYETQHNVTLIAQAWDTGSPSLSNTTVVFINIININDNTPVFSKATYEISIPEQQHVSGVVLTVSATDRDEGDYGVVRYSLNNAYFYINNITGDIYMYPNRTDLDREVMTTYTFEVTAYDSPNHPNERLQSIVPVYINLGDINDNCPEFLFGTSYSGLVIETAGVGDQVLEMYASDKDYRDNASIRFSLENVPTANNGIPLFEIISVTSVDDKTKSGRILVANSLRDRPGRYNFTVVATDRNGEKSSISCSKKVAVTVTVQEAVNDAPSWVRPPSSNYSIDVLESQYKGMLVYDCKARDFNSGEAGIIDYYFNVEQRLVQNTTEFRINKVTCIIRAEIEYDRERVGSYVLTLVAKDRGDPSASSETVLIVKVLDVNDNYPEFPMSNGVTIPYTFFVEEGKNFSTAGPFKNGTLGRVSATDKDSTHTNNQVFYKILAGNDDGLFVLNRITGEVSLDPVRAKNGVDRETEGSYSMDVLAYNEVNDDSVIRNRRKRSANPSIVTVNIQVEDINDTPPQFTSPNYYGCISQDSRFGQSILTVEAVDTDLVGGNVMWYTKVSESTRDYFGCDLLTGVVRNTRLLNDIPSPTPLVTIEADDNGNEANNVTTFTARTTVQIFVTSSANEVVLKVDQPSADVRFYQDQLKRAIMNSSSTGYPISYVCIRDIRNGINSDGQQSYSSSDVYVAAIGLQDGKYVVYPGSTLHNVLYQQIANDQTGLVYRSLYVNSVQNNEQEGGIESLIKEDSVLAIFIIAILLIFLALLLFILACCLISNSRRKKIKKLGAERNTHVEIERHELPPQVVTSVNPMYDNKGYQPASPSHSDEYAVVQKRPPPAATTVSAPIAPVILTYPEDDRPELPPPIDDNDDDDDDQGPVIITEPIMTEEMAVTRAPPPHDFFDPEPVIETEVMPDDEMPGPTADIDDVIDVEFRDDDDDVSPANQSPRSGGSSPHQSPRSDGSSPHQSPRSDGSIPHQSPRSDDDQEYRIEADIM